MIPLYKPYTAQNTEEIRTILESGQLGYGPWGRKFESELSIYTGNEQVITTSSYFMAVQVALAALGIKPGDEVIASPMCCLASSSPLLTYGVTIRFADIDPRIGMLDPQSVASLITPRTKAIVHNHFCGYVGYTDEINEIGAKNGLWVIDDCVEAFGADHNGRKAGSWGADVTLFSFQTIRYPNTIDGGALAFKDQASYEKARMLRDCGVDRKLFRDAVNEISETYDIPQAGYTAMMSEVNSYIGCMQMADAATVLQKQRDNARKWDRLLAENPIPGVRPLPIKDNTTPNYWVYGVLAENKIETMLRFRNAGYYSSGVHHPNSHYSVFGNPQTLPGVEEFNSHFTALPSGWWVETIPNEI